MKALSTVVPALVITSLMSATPSYGDWLGFHVGSNGFGLSVGVGDWAVYGTSWYDPHWSVDLDVALGGHGDWVQVDGLGRVWRPYVAADWRPYTYGRWVWANAGWTWVAYEPWGYIPHHYGEWALTSFGWVWVPGYAYRPANVVWVGSGSLVGWYPCAPRGWSHACRGFCRPDGYGYTWGRTWGYNRGYSHGYDHGHRDGYWEGWRDARHATWVEWKHMTTDNVSRRAVAPADVGRQVGRTSVQPLPQPPGRSEVGRRTGASVPEVRMAKREVRMGDRRVTMMRPEGVSRDVERHAKSTVTTALAPSVSRRMTRSRGDDSRSVATDSERGRTTRVGASRSAPGSIGSTTRFQTSRRRTDEPPSRVQSSRTMTSESATRTRSSRIGTGKPASGSSRTLEGRSTRPQTRSHPVSSSTQDGRVRSVRPPASHDHRAVQPGQKTEPRTVAASSPTRSRSSFSRPRSAGSRPSRATVSREAASAPTRQSSKVGRLAARPSEPPRPKTVDRNKASSARSSQKSSATPRRSRR